MPIAFATTNPARLTGTVGKNGMNRPHDVALVQVLHLKSKFTTPENHS